MLEGVCRSNYLINPLIIHVNIGLRIAPNGIIKAGEYKENIAHGKSTYDNRGRMKNEVRDNGE